MRPRFWQTGWPSLLAVACAWLALVAPATAQNEPGEPSDATVPTEAAPQPAPARSDAPADDSTSGALPLEVLPKVFLLKDRDGKLQAVPGMKLEEFMEFWKERHQLAQENQRPAYTLERLDISGTAARASAELIARIKVVIHEAGWVAIPLRLNGAALREAPTYEGSGQHVMRFDPAGDGHLSWIHGRAEETHELTLKLVVPVEQVGPQSRLKLSVPRATVAQLHLQVPLAQAAAEVSEGSTLDTVRPLAGGKTELRVIGLGGDFELTWHPSDSNVASLPTILEATSKQLIRINGRSVSTDVTLTVSSLGSEFDHFQVRLPPGADYIGTPEAGVSLVAVDAAAADGKLYDVRLEKKTSGRVNIRLVTERAHDAAQNDGVLELAGFEVLGAVRQWGTIAVQVEGNWQVVWGENDHVRAVDDIEANVRRDELAAGFEYFVQPYSLTARVVPQKTRTRVEPSYTLLVSGDDVRLQGRLKYIIRGAKVRSLLVDLPGWEVDSVGPASLVNVDTAIAGVDDSLTIPLLQATSGELELTFEARQRMPAEVAEVRLDLPRPHGDLMPADVAIESDDPIELLPRLEELRHLAPQAKRSAVTLPNRQQDPLYYRTTGEQARFVADRKVHDQEISATVSTTLRVRETETLVEQLLAFQFAYVPTDHVTLIVPAAMRLERLTILHEGRRLEAVPARERPASDGGATQVRVDLPNPTIGRCELQLSYARRHDKPPTQASALVTVPLVVPGEGLLTDNQLQVIAEQEISASYPQGPWTAEAGSSTVGTVAGLEAPGALLLSAPRAIPEVTLAVSSKQRTNETTTAIEKAVIETRLTDRVRQDRALLRLTTNRQRLEVTLPEGADSRTLTLAVDGTRVVPESVIKRVITIPLTNTRRDHLVELRYHFSGRPDQGSLVLAGPQIPSARWVQQLYWQLVVPGGEHVLFTPDRYTEELAWSWADLFWRREPTFGEQDLHRWVTDTASLELPGLEASALPAVDARAAPLATNRYLFSTVGEIQPLELYTVGRARLVLLASFPLLVVGLLLIYFPATRHPAIFLLLALTVAGGGLVAPQLAILLAQASLLGLVLVALAALLAYFMPRVATPPVTPVRGSSFAVVERSVTELYHRSPAGGSHPASTATNPLVPTSPEIEP